MYVSDEVGLRSSKGVDFAGEARDFACRIVFMNDALRGRFAEGTHRLWEFFLSGRHISLIDSHNDFLYRRAKGRPKRRIAFVPLDILPCTLDG